MGELFANDFRLFSDNSGPSEADVRLINAYLHVGRTLDDLPYTRDFDVLYAMLPEPREPQRDVFRRLQTLRKAGKLPRLGRSTAEPVRVTRGEEDLMEKLIVEACGTIGQRDQLLYHPKFDEVVLAFNTATGRHLTPHDAWRLVAKIAK